MADALAGFPDAYERRCRALECLATLDRPVFAKVWESQHPDLIMTLETTMVDAAVAAEWACRVLGLEPKRLPIRSSGS